MQFYSVEGGASARGVQAICAFDSLRVRMGARTATMSIYPPNPGTVDPFLSCENLGEPLLSLVLSKGETRAERLIPFDNLDF